VGDEQKLTAGLFCFNITVKPVLSGEESLIVSICCCQVCTLCEAVTGAHSQPSACIQCSHGRCYQAFHTTCAYAAGVQFETSDWPFPIYCTCLKHANKAREEKVRIAPQ
jgi:hypothetical protein